MVLRFEDVTSQVDGVTDTFRTSKPYVTKTITLGYNGQLYPGGWNIAEELDIDLIKLSFVPAVDTHALLIIYDDGIYPPINEPILRLDALPPRSSF